MKVKVVVSMAVVVGILAFASLSLATAPSKKAGAVAPRLQVGADQVKIWDRPDAFGPVPSQKRALGKKVCGPGKKAVGFHPKALDENGKVFPRGGFLCVPDKP